MFSMVKKIFKSGRMSRRSISVKNMHPAQEYAGMNRGWFEMNSEEERRQDIESARKMAKKIISN